MFPAVPPTPRLAYRVGDIRSTDIRAAQIICTTYEHTRWILVDGECRIYPRSKAPDKTWPKLSL
jgi:hypothetical protein